MLAVVAKRDRRRQDNEGARARAGLCVLRSGEGVRLCCLGHSLEPRGGEAGIIGESICYTTLGSICDSATYDHGFPTGGVNIAQYLGTIFRAKAILQKEFQVPISAARGVFWSMTDWDISLAVIPCRRRSRRRR